MVADEVEVPFAELDWSGDDQFSQWLAEDRRRGFDLAEPPLFRLALIRCGPADYQFVWTFHHTLLDGRSHRLVLEEAFAAYEAIRDGAPPSSAPVRPFREHVEWLGRQDPAAAERYWRGLLAGFEAPTRVPAAEPRPGPPPRSGEGGEDLEISPPSPLRGGGPGGRGFGVELSEQSVTLPEVVMANLKAFAAENDLTPTTLLHAAWAVLLARYSGETNVVFGGTRSGRRPDLERAGASVGLLVNTLPVRARVAADMKVSDLLAELRHQWLAGRDFDYAAPVDVQTWAGLPGGTPLYETIVVAENYDLNESLQSLGGAWAKRTVTLHESPHYPLALTVSFGSEARLRLLYDRRRTDDATAGRLLGHVRTLLEAIPNTDPSLALQACPDKPEALAKDTVTVRDLPMLTPQERQQVIFDWNDTAGDYPRDRRLEQLVDEQVDRTPDAVAVIHEGQAWTYRELDERANRLAHHLRGLGAKPGTLVGVCMNRSAEMVAAVLGILKAGAAYVPLDPAYPKERLAFLLRDTEAVALVTQVRRIGQLPEMSVPVVCIDADWPTIGLHSVERPDKKVSGTFSAAEKVPDTFLSAEDVAYIIYTSGSTGTPKGVVLRHRAVVNTIDWVNKTFGVGPGDRVLWVTSLCFDLSVYDLFGVLSAGGTVRVATGGELRDPERLLAVLAGEPITMWDSAPSLLAQLAPHFGKGREGEAPAEPAPKGSAGASPSLSKLRLVLLSGDWIPVALPDQAHSAFPNAKVVSLGGATEAAIWSNWFSVETVNPAWASIPYGRPIRNARYYLLDVHGQPAPVGVPAELYIAGDCVADGYWRRPELTAERFVSISDFRFQIADCSDQSAIRNLPSAILYRTGDLAKFWPDGTIEFLGRRDHQVKVRGFRIELGEVEATLAKHPAVEQAVAVVAPDAVGEKQLIVYAMPRPGEMAETSELRKYLATGCRSFWSRRHVMTLPALPLSASGKVDRKALPAPDRGRPPADRRGSATGCDRVRPGGRSGARCSGCGACGVHDNFFELGGHSLKAAQVVSRVRQRLGQELPLAAFFRAPTVAASARALRAGSVNDENPNSVARARR